MRAVAVLAVFSLAAMQGWKNHVGVGQLGQPGYLGHATDIHGLDFVA